MTITSKEMKAQARSLLAGNYGTIIAATLLSSLITVILSNIFSQTSSNNLALFIGFASSLILSLLSSVLDAGFTHMYLKTARGEGPVISDIFHWFTGFADKVILIALALIGINLALVLLLSVFLFIAFFASGINALQLSEQLISHLSMFLRTWNISYLEIPGLSFSSAAIPLAVILIWALIAAAVNLRFFLVYYLLCDNPDQSPAAVLMQSSRLMRGSRLRLILLYISFAGFFLLGLLSFGLAFLWILPYIRMTETLFYLNLARNTFQEEISPGDYPGDYPDENQKEPEISIY